MLFCPQAFLFFFAVSLLIDWLIPVQTAHVWLLLIVRFSSFYAMWKVWLVLLIGSTTVVWIISSLGGWTTVRCPGSASCCCSSAQWPPHSED